VARTLLVQPYAVFAVENVDDDKVFRCPGELLLVR
jgi:hypothetical protein